MSLPLPAEEQTRQRNERALRRLATSITPPEIAEQNRLRDQQVQSQFLNRQNYSAGLRNSASNDIQSAYRTRQGAHIAGVMSTITQTQTATETVHTQSGVAPHESISQSGRPRMRQGSLVDIDEPVPEEEPDTDEVPFPEETPGSQGTGGRSRSPHQRRGRSDSHNPFLNSQGEPVENPRAGGGGGGGNGDGGGGGNGGGGGEDGGGGPFPLRSPRPPNEWSSSDFMRAMSQVIGQGIGDALKN
ncbi:hypothetical protein DFH08DRAFT_824306 [Mycena albidolilacea]|uniref:Uncharacterized protein n=1 Tax=Mycena albidolilacea TaxID=1033008 RepID=A0AAD7EAP4_9AGAR|nr:hypothetical protein DFH08DRAFT_824306 [Mycena albidolilacea]